jgi:hypothetical protein
MVSQLGRAISQSVSRWLPTAAARVRAWVWSSGICGEQSGAGAGFLLVLRFPLPQSLFHQILRPHNHPTKVQQARSGRRAEWTQSGRHPTLCELKKKKISKSVIKI